MNSPKVEGLPVGPEVDTTPAQYPPHTTLHGRFVTLEPLTIAHTDDLFSVLGGAEHAYLWTYMFDGPFLDIASFRSSIAVKVQSRDPLYFAVCSTATREAIGLVTLMRIDVVNRSIEVGCITFGPPLQRSSGATECMYLLARLVFEELGYRRYEWKCHNLNSKSKKAATRLGFSFEGLFRQCIITKGRNRDTAWFSMLDGEWPVIKEAFVKWLDAGNFDAEGHQIVGLSEIRESLQLQAS